MPMTAKISYRAGRDNCMSRRDGNNYRSSFKSRAYGALNLALW